MSQQDAGGKTSQMEMIATRVVEQQARVCAVIMENVKETLTELTTKVAELEKTVVAMDKAFVAEMTDVKGRLKLFTATTTVVGFVVAIVGLIQLFK